MITRSSNLAANLILEQTGFAEVEAAWSRARAHRSVVRRGIADQHAADFGITNVVTARDISALLGSIAVDSSPAASAMIDTLTRQQRTEDLGSGLPPGTRAAYKNGWVMGVRHAAGVIYPPDVRPFVLAICCTTPAAENKPGDESCRIVTEITKWAWSQRHSITAAG
jgi:beta-lactamase class A